MPPLNPVPPQPRTPSTLRTLLISAAVTVGVVFCLLGVGFVGLVVRELMQQPTPVVPTVAAVPTRAATRTPSAAVAASAVPATVPAATPTPALPELRDLVQSAWQTQFQLTELSLVHTAENQIVARVADVDPQRDLTVSATFVNPYAAAEAAFDFGFQFRSAPGIRYALDVQSDQTYHLDLVRNGEWIEVATGAVSGLRLAAGERNDLLLEVNGAGAALTLNGVLQARLNLSDHQAPGSVSVAVGLYADHQRAGAETLVRDFNVSGRDQPTEMTVQLRESFVTTNTAFVVGPFSDRNGLLERTIANGSYSWTYRTLGSTFVRTEFASELPSDFAVALTTDVVRAQAEDGSALAVKTGIALRLSRDADGNLSHYLFHVAADGSRAWFYLYRNGEWTNVAAVDNPPYRPGEPNQLAVVVRGQRYRCFVNGTEVLSVSHFTLSGGTLALTIEVNGVGTTEARFDDVELRVGR